MCAAALHLLGVPIARDRYVWPGMDFRREWKGTNDDGVFLLCHDSRPGLLILTLSRPFLQPTGNLIFGPEYSAKSLQYLQNFVILF